MNDSDGGRGENTAAAALGLEQTRTQTEILSPAVTQTDVLPVARRTEALASVGLRAAPRLDALGPAYGIPAHAAPTDLVLSGNEGSTPPSDLIDTALAASDDPYAVRRYGRPTALEHAIAGRYGVAADRVIVCAGGDDALGRAILACCWQQAPLVLPVPTFEMLERYAALASAEVKRVPWPRGPYPTEAVLADARGVRADGSGQAGCVMVVTPNNPTGASTNAATIVALARALPRSLIVVDQAYAEYDDAGDTVLRATLELSNALCVRTFSKAWGLAGLRVGFAIGAPRVVAWLRSVGQPYAVSTASQRVALAALERGGAWVAPHVARVREERQIIARVLDELGASPRPSQANFVLADLASRSQAAWLCDAMASLGIAVRRFARPESLAAAVRISCPGDASACVRVSAALRAALAPEALLFDMDGVLADVSRSFRRAIVETAASYEVVITDDDIAEAKARGGANDDWALTQRLLAERGVEADLAQVTTRFEALYQGDDETPGLYQAERLLLSREALAMLRRRMPFAVVTGRPRRDAERFLDDHGISNLFDAVICREDCERLKPDPAPVRAALEALGVRHAWLLGDTVDDMVAARAAGVVPIAVRAPGEPPARDEVLTRAGAARVLAATTEIGRLLDDTTVGVTDGQRRGA